VLGPETAARLDNEFFTLELDCIAVKGKKEGVNIFTVFRNPTADSLQAWYAHRDTHQIMLEMYRKQMWNEAAGQVRTLKGRFDGHMDHYYDLWLERIEEMKNANLPADWDGVFRATSK
jgi:hypothetical protein